VEAQIAGDIEVEIQGRLLEHDAELGKSARRMLQEILTTDPDAAGVGHEQATKQLE
jgi:hypothetical protein